MATRLRRAVNIEDLRRLAAKRLPSFVFDIIEGGVDEELGRRRNEQAFAELRLIPRSLVDVSSRDLGCSLFGRQYRLPFGVAPTGPASLFWLDADLLLARAAEHMASIFRF